MQGISLNFENLPPQQWSCLSYLSRGMTYKEIGATMGLSHRTVEHYLNIIKEKVGIKKRSALISAFIYVLDEVEKSPASQLHMLYKRDGQ